MSVMPIRPRGIKPTMSAMPIGSTSDTDLWAASRCVSSPLARQSEPRSLCYTCTQVCVCVCIPIHPPVHPPTVCVEGFEESPHLTPPIFDLGSLLGLALYRKGGSGYICVWNGGLRGGGRILSCTTTQFFSRRLPVMPPNPPTVKVLLHAYHGYGLFNHQSFGQATINE